MPTQNQPGWNAPDPQQHAQPYPPGPYQPYPAPPMNLTMPGPVRAARTLAYVAAGLVVIAVVLSAVVAGPRGAGAALGSQLPVVGVFVCALRFEKAGPGAKVTAIVFASFMILFGMGALGRGLLGGIVQLGLGIALVVTLSQGRSGDWFRRPNR